MNTRHTRRILSWIIIVVFILENVFTYGSSAVSADEPTSVSKRQTRYLPHLHFKGDYTVLFASTDTYMADESGAGSIVYNEEDDILEVTLGTDQGIIFPLTEYADGKYDSIKMTYTLDNGDVDAYVYGGTNDVGRSGLDDPDAHVVEVEQTQEYKTVVYDRDTSYSKRGDDTIFEEGLVKGFELFNCSEESDAVIKIKLIKFRAMVPNDVRNSDYKITKIADGRKITIDGIEDNAYAGLKELPFTSRIVFQQKWYSPGVPSNAEAKAKLAWNKNGMYCFVKVKDGNISNKNRCENDGLKFVLDEDHDLRTETGYDEENDYYFYGYHSNFDAFYYQYIGFKNDEYGKEEDAKTNGIVTPSKALNTAKTDYAGIRAAYKFTETEGKVDGYNIEFFIPFMTEKIPGDVIGFDMILDDCAVREFPEGGLEAEIYFFPTERQKQYWYDPSECGSIMLADEDENAPVIMDEPTESPTLEPTAMPTTKPTAIPTATPTAVPTASPTTKPTASPTAVPTASLTPKPTTKPTAKPTTVPSDNSEQDPDDNLNQPGVPTRAPASSHTEEKESGDTANPGTQQGQQTTPAGDQNLTPNAQSGDSLGTALLPGQSDVVSLNTHKTSLEDISGKTNTGNSDSKMNKSSSKLRKPIFTLNKGVTSKGNKCVIITLRSYNGTNIEIYNCKGNKKIKLKLINSNIKKNNKKFRLAYSRSNTVFKLCIRTYRTAGGKKVRSPYSVVKKIRV